MIAIHAEGMPSHSKCAMGGVSCASFAVQRRLVGKTPSSPLILALIVISPLAGLCAFTDKTGPANEYKQMKMGLERGLREKIPEIVDVVQDLGEGGPELSPETVETVLDTVRPFLNVAGGTIELADLRGVGGMQACFMSALERLVFGGG